jgi:hypothetical protein
MERRVTNPAEGWDRLPGLMVPFNWRAFWQKHRILYRDVGDLRSITSSVALRFGLFFVGQASWTLDALFFPRWRDTPMAPPIFILGHQRSGTTLLHRLLSEDRTHARSLLFHEMILPAISAQRAIAGVGALDRRLTGGKLASWLHAVQERTFGPLDHIHRLRFDEIEEDEFVLWNIYASTMCINDAPLNTVHKDLEDLRDFHKWPIERQTKAFGWYRACLLKKIYRNPAPAGAGLPWIVSKNPHFSQKIPELLRVFPDAKLIYLIRNPLEAIASRLDLIRGIWRHRFKEFHDMTAEQAEAILKDSLRTYLNAERDLDRVPERQRFVVRYEDLLKRIPETVRDIYRHFGLPRPDENLAAALRAFDTREKHVSRHQYRLEEFGIAAERVRSELAPVFARLAVDA